MKEQKDTQLFVAQTEDAEQDLGCSRGDVSRQAKRKLSGYKSPRKAALPGAQFHTSQPPLSHLAASKAMKMQWEREFAWEAAANTQQ